MAEKRNLRFCVEFPERYLDRTGVYIKLSPGTSVNEVVATAKSMNTFRYTTRTNAIRPTRELSTTDYDKLDREVAPLNRHFISFAEDLIERNGLVYNVRSLTMLAYGAVNLIHIVRTIQEGSTKVRDDIAHQEF